jgi:hypothetical protein
LVGIEALDILAMILIKVGQSIIDENRCFHGLRNGEVNDTLRDV